MTVPQDTPDWVGSTLGLLRADLLYNAAGVAFPGGPLLNVAQYQSLIITVKVNSTVAGSMGFFNLVWVSNNNVTAQDNWPQLRTTDYAPFGGTYRLQVPVQGAQARLQFTHTDPGGTFDVTIQGSSQPLYAGKQLQLVDAGPGALLAGVSAQNVAAGGSVSALIGPVSAAFTVQATVVGGKGRVYVDAFPYTGASFVRRFLASVDVSTATGFGFLTQQRMPYTIFRVEVDNLDTIARAVTYSVFDVS